MSQLKEQLLQEAERLFPNNFAAQDAYMKEKQKQPYVPVKIEFEYVIKGTIVLEEHSAQVLEEKYKNDPKKYISEQIDLTTNGDWEGKIKQARVIKQHK